MTDVVRIHHAPQRAVIQQARPCVALHSTPQRVSVQQTSQGVALHATPQRVVVHAGGPRGPRGLPGASAAGVPPYTFAFGDATPSEIWTPDADGFLEIARLLITTSFDGESPALSIGTESDPEAFMPATHNDAANGGEFMVTPDASIAAGTPILLYITPGFGATQGSGRVLLRVIPFG